MRLSVVLCLSLILATSLAASMKAKLNSSSAKQIDTLRTQKHSWSKLILNLAELHMMSEGSLDELVQVISDLLEDLSGKRIQNGDNYQQASIKENEAISRLTAEIASANSDIASTTSLLNDVLYPKKISLLSAIANQEQDLLDSSVYLQNIAQERDQSHQNWQDRVEDHSSAIAAINEAQGILEQLIFGENISMLQIKTSKSALIQVEKKLGKRIDATLAKALVELATKEFANQDTVRSVNDMLEQIKGNMVASLAGENANEEREERQYEDNVTVTSKHISSVENSLASNKIDLANTINSIVENEAFLSQRKDDLARSTLDLENEQIHFQIVTQNYKDVEEQLNLELAAGEEALTVIQNGNFATYISDRLNNIDGSDSSHIARF